MKEWLKTTSRFSHENLLRVMEISLPLDYRVYVWMFSSTSGEILVVIASFIQRGDMIIIYCCGTLQIKLYTVRIFIKQPLICKLLVHVWATSYKCQL